jgi:hypothetical protein
MDRKHLAWLRRGALLTVLFLPPVLGWSDGAFPTSSDSKKTCYCGCDMKAGSPMCMHMCELTRYANRSWASSCQKKKPALGPTPPHQSGSHSSRKSNRVQDALL